MPAGALKLTPEAGGPHGKPRTASGESDRLYPGRLIGEGYRLERRLGQGGRVWRALDPAGRPVAVKTGPRSLIEREYRIVAGLEHPHVVAVIDRIECAAGSFVVFEYLSGGDLVSLAGLAPRHWLPAAGAIGSVLAWLHHRGIVHRDVKARNVLFDDSNRPRLIDFGSAASIGSPWSVGGTTTVAPRRGREPVTTGDDVYSFAALLHELLYGAPPAAGSGRRQPAAARLARLVDGRLDAPAGARRPDLGEFVAVIESGIDEDGMLT